MRAGFSLFCFSFVIPAKSIPFTEKPGLPGNYDTKSLFTVYYPLLATCYSNSPSFLRKQESIPPLLSTPYYSPFTAYRSLSILPVYSLKSMVYSPRVVSHEFPVTSSLSRRMSGHLYPRLYLVSCVSPPSLMSKVYSLKSKIPLATRYSLLATDYSSFKRKVAHSVTIVSVYPLVLLTGIRIPCIFMVRIRGCSCGEEESGESPELSPQL